MTFDAIATQQRLDIATAVYAATWGALVGNQEYLNWEVDAAIVEGKSLIELLARDAVRKADALMKELNK